MLQTPRVRIVRLLKRRGFLPHPGHDDVSPEPDSLLPFISAASTNPRVALGPDAGRPIDRYRAPPRYTPTFEPGGRRRSVAFDRGLAVLGDFELDDAIEGCRRYRL